MENNKHYFIVGLFLLLTISAIVIFSVWLMGGYDEKNYTIYRIHFNESVNGLAIGSPVKFRGVQVGKVDAMAIEPSNTNMVDVDIKVLKTVTLKTDTTAILKLQGITGGMYVELYGGSAAADILPQSDDKNISEIKAQTSTIAAIMDEMPMIVDKLSYITDQLAKLLSNKNVSTFSKTMKNLHKSSSDVNELTEDLKKHPAKLLFKR